jgi:CRISPR-associated endonuclease Cas2
MVRLPERITRYVVVFDICTYSDSWEEKRFSVKRRTKLWRILFEYGHRTQLSVFEVEVFPADFRFFVSRLSSVIRKETDKVYVYPLDRRSLRNIVRVGNFGREELKGVL